MKKIMLSLTLLVFTTLAANLSAIQNDEAKLDECAERAKSYAMRLFCALKECDRLSEKAEHSWTQEFLENQKAACYVFMQAKSDKEWHNSGCEGIE